MGQLSCSLDSFTFCRFVGSRSLDFSFGWSSRHKCAGEENSPGLVLAKEACLALCFIASWGFALLHTKAFAIFYILLSGDVKIEVVDDDDTIPVHDHDEELTEEDVIRSLSDFHSAERKMAIARKQELLRIMKRPCLGNQDERPSLNNWNLDSSGCLMTGQPMGCLTENHHSRKWCSNFQHTFRSQFRMLDCTYEQRPCEDYNHEQCQSSISLLSSGSWSAKVELLVEIYILKPQNALKRRRRVYHAGFLGLSQRKKKVGLNKSEHEDSIWMYLIVLVIANNWEKSLVLQISRSVQPRKALHLRCSKLQDNSSDRAFPPTLYP